MEDYTDFKSAFNERYSLPTRKMLRMLSDDSRTSVTSLSKSLGLSRKTVKEKLKAMEKALQIRYTLQLNEEMLQIPTPHFIALKFSSAPDYNEVARLLRESYIPQLAVRARGSYDLLIYANSPSDSDYIRWEKTMQIKLAKYKVLWESSEVAHKQLGFFPVRNELIDKLNIVGKYKTLLKILNENSRMSFQEISKRTGMHFNTVAYNFNKLVDIGYVKKFTLVCKPQSGISVVAIFGKYILEENFESDASKIRKVFRSDEEFPVFNRYPVIAQLIGTYDYFDIGVFDDLQTGYKKFVTAYKIMLKRHLAKLHYCELSEAILGDLPLRSVDSNKEYSTISWTADE